MQNETADAVSLNRPDDPANEKDGRHREGQVQIGIGAAEQRPVDMKRTGGIVMAPADGADAGYQTEPVQKQNENEDRGEKPEGLFHQLPTDNVFEKIVEALDQPFPKILRASRDGFDFARRDLREEKDAGGHEPGHAHGICHGKFADVKKNGGLERN